MIKCNKCNNELQDGSVFCNKCGASLFKREKSFTPKTKLIIPSAIGVLLVIVILFLLFSNNPINQYHQAIKASNYLDANEIYETEIKGDREKEKQIELFLIEELEDIKQVFITDEADYNSATIRLETIQKTELLKSEVNATLSYINKLHASRVAFKTGEELLKTNNIKDAIQEYKKVIEEDKNYPKSQEIIKEKSAEYKESILIESDRKASEHNFAEAIELVNEGLTILTNDADLESKKIVYEKQNEDKLAAERKIKMEELKNKQEVTVKETSIVVQHDTYKALYPDLVQVIVQNNSSKTVKDMEVSILGYDSNGLPIEIKSGYGNSSFEFIGHAPNANIVSGDSFGENNGWRLDKSHGIHTVLACVKEVEYYDGTKWENPYYDYWIEEYKEKPLD